MDDLIVKVQCEELDPEEIGQLLINMYEDLEDLYGDEQNEKFTN